MDSECKPHLEEVVAFDGPVMVDDVVSEKADILTGDGLVDVQ